MNKKPSQDRLKKKIEELERDIAELKRANKTISSQNKIMSTLLDNLEAGVFMLEAPSGKPLLANKQATQLLGRGTLDHADQNTLAQVYYVYKYGSNEPYPTDDMPAVRGLLGEKHHIDDMVVVHPDGSRRLLEVFGSPIKDSLGNITGSLVTFFDISHRKQMEEALRASEQRHRIIFENSPLGIIRYDHKGAITDFNDKFIEIMGSTREKLMGFNTATRSTPEMRHAIKKALAGKVSVFEDQYTSITGGKTTIIRVVFNPVNPNQSPTDVIATVEDISKRKIAEQALLESETKYRETVDNSPDLIYKTDTKGIITFISPSVFRLSGYTVQESVGMKMAEEVYVDPEKRKDLLAQLANTGSVKNFQARLRRKDGSVWWASTNAQFYKDDQGNVLGVEGVSRDVTDLKLAEQALKTSEEKYRRLADNAVDMIFRMSLPEGAYEYVSPAAEKIFGYTPEAFYETPLLVKKTIHKESQAYFKREWKNLLAGNMPEFYEFRIIHRSGREKWLNQRNVLIRDDQGYPIALEGIVTDITLRKYMERQLKETKNQYKQLSDATFEAIFLSENGICISQNMSAKKQFGYSDREAIGQPGTQWIHPDHREDVKQKMRTGYNGVYQSVALRKDKTTFPCEIQGLTIKQDGRTIRITALRDITDRIKAENEKLAAQKIAADQTRHAMVGELAGKMAHDFNNVLGVIMGNAQLSMINCKDPEIQKTLELIYEQTVRGKNLTKNLVVFAKDQEPKQEYFKISEKIDIVLTLLKKDLEGIIIIKDDMSGVPEALADPGMIEHALVNLIQNSIHALSRSLDPMIWIRTYHSDNRICFDIEDNGCGIPEAHQESIYDPAFTLKGPNDVTGSYEGSIKGTGYGMSNVKKYVEQHKGTITLESKMGSGTKFSISLPVIKKELTRAEKEIITVSPSLSGRYILLVEDEQAISDVQYRVLTGHPFNHKVGLATNGQVAMDLFDRNPYDLISLDYMLPGKLNGMDVYHHVRQKNKTIPILFISGNIEFLESIKTLKQKDLNIDHLSKPCRNLEYVESINALIQRCTPKKNG